MNRKSYSSRQQILMNRLVRDHAVPIYKALQENMNAAAAFVRAHGVSDPSFGTVIISQNLEKAITKLYLDAATRAKKNYSATKRFGTGSKFIQKVLAYLHDYLLSKVVIPIENTTKKIISGIINRAIQEGWGVEKTAKYFETTDVNKVRARMIVRTESVRATNYTQWAAADNETYVVNKEWIAIEDKRTRASHTHAGVDGQIHELHEPFSNGLMYPGDPDGSAEEVINCRCTMGYSYARDVNNDLIKKNKSLSVV